MNFHELKLFLHLSGSLHFGTTSRECNISPSALSRVIRRLESNVGQPLFERDTRSVSLTTAGFKLKSFAEETMEKWQELNDSFFSGPGQLRGELSIFSSVTACYGILPDILSAYRSRYPDVHIKLKTGDAAFAISMLQGGVVDIAVSVEPEVPDEQLLFKPITKTPLIFIGPSISCSVAKMISEPGPIRWNEIPMIIPEQGLSRERFELWFKERGIVPEIYAQVSGNEAIIAMVMLGCGVGIVPGLVLEKSPLKNELRIIPVEPALKPYTVGICIRKKKKDHTLIRAFWELC